MKTEYDLHYTQLDGTRRTQTFSTLEKLTGALARAKAKNPAHDMQEQIQTVTEDERKALVAAEFAKLPKVTFAERMGARHLRRTSPVTAAAAGY